MFKSLRFLFITFCFFSIQAQGFTPIDASMYDIAWEKLKKKPKNLAVFIENLPKGADLHCHASGATATENLIHIAQTHHYCIDKKFALHLPVHNKCLSGIDSLVFFKKPKNREAVLKAWSMSHFKQTNKEDGKQHFFNTFGKFSVMVPDHWPEIIANVQENAYAQHVQYLELMLAMHGQKPLNHHEPSIQTPADYQLWMSRADVKSFIEKNIEFFRGLKHAVNQYTSESARSVELAWILEIKRNENFAQFMLDAAEVYAIANSVSDIAGINMVQPEYAKYANKDYLKQMKWLHFLNSVYPRVKLVLHAGEVPFDVAKKNKIAHIQKALEFAKPLRIGHGTTITCEPNYQNTLNYMQTHQIAVEINLTSNDQILGVTRDSHPLRLYLNNKVPVVISSDDPGISRNSLSHEYFRAVEEHQLSLSELLAVNRNSLTYSLLPGQSLWENPKLLKIIPQCKQLDSKKCKLFISNQPKAKQQWLLEKNMADYFKKNFPVN